MITPIKPDLRGTDLYSATQAAAVLGIHRNTLLKWANDGLVSFKESRNGRRYYRGLELMRLWTWQHNKV